MQQPECSLERLRWQCRRGMLELDLLFEAFIDNGYQQLSRQEQETFQQLLGYPDQTLLKWLMGEIEPEDDALARLVKRIRQSI